MLFSLALICERRCGSNEEQSLSALGMEHGKLARELHSFFLHGILFLVGEVLAHVIMKALIK